MQTRLHDPLLRALVLQMLIKGLQEDSASTGRAVELAFFKKNKSLSHPSHRSTDDKNGLN